MCLLLISGGHETTSKLIANGVRLFGRHPEQRRAVQSARPKTRRFYTRWWVWTLASIGAIGIASAIITDVASTGSGRVRAR